MASDLVSDPARARTRLETLRHGGPPPPTCAQVHTVLNGVRNGDEPDTIAARLGWPGDRVAETVEAFGVFWMRAGKLGKLRIVEGDRTARNGDGSFTVAISDAWKATGRPVASALAVITATSIGADAVDRFHIRHFKPGPAIVSASGLWLLAWLGQTGLWVPVLSDLDADDRQLADRLAVSWDYWERVTRRTREAVNVLTGDGADPQTIIDAATTARWIAPADADRIIDPARILADDPDDRSAAVIMAARRGGAARWQVPRIPDGLTGAHAHMVCQAAGLSTDEATTRKVRSGVRAFLSDLGATSDLDLDVPDAMTAWANGLLDDWRDSRRARAAGDVTWHEQWEAAATG